MRVLCSPEWERLNSAGSNSGKSRDWAQQGSKVKTNDAPEQALQSKAKQSKAMHCNLLEVDKYGFGKYHTFPLFFWHPSLRYWCSLAATMELPRPGPQAAQG